MIIPTRRAAALAFLGAAPLPAAYFIPQAIFWAAALDLLLLALYFLERRRLLAADVRLVPGREPTCRVGDAVDIGYRVENRGRAAVSVVLRQPWPEGWRGEGDDRAALDVPPGGAAPTTFPARPGRRGRFILPAPEVTLRGGWFARRERIAPGAAVLVYPSLAELAGVDRMRRGRGMAAQGMRRRRQVGVGSEFERLRAYLPDDDFRHINWKTTARAGKPVTNVFQAERGRDVLLCFDCGRMMAVAVGGRRIIDLTAESGLALARAVVKDGDRVGFAAFAEQVSLYIPPKGGRVGARRVANAIAGIEATPAYTSFANLAAAIGARQNRRSLVVAFSDFSDPQLAVELAAAMAILRRRHAALVVGLRDPELAAAAETPAADRAARCRALAARTLRDEREAASRELRKLGVEVVECEPGGMVAAALDRYLAVKAVRLAD